MALQVKTNTLSAFLVTYEAGLKATAPVRTGRLRDSIVVLRPTLAAIFDIPVDAVNYAIYANNKHHFVERNDFRIEDFATEITEALWDDFFTDNNKPNT